ncbi:MAG: penicillin-binding protein 2 [Lachnospiraceae bacterium]|nr:penicillin-binding protein 2 [Lachnospiraceae bacterium]
MRRGSDKGKDNNSKKQKRILKRMQRSLILVFGGICVLFIALIGRLMYIENTSGERYKKIVLSQQQYNSSVIPYKRGDIIDAKGTVLATSVDVYNVILDCRVLNADTNKEKIDTTIKHLTTCFPEITEEQVRNELSNKPKSQYIILLKKTSYESMRKFSDIMEAKETRKEIAGVWFEKEYQRQYPYPTLASGIIGFTASGNEGVTGLEYQYSDTLNGINGRSFGYQNEENALEATVVEPENGKHIILAIDTNIQTVVQKEIIKWNKKVGSKNTAVLIMDPRNGEILAMSTYPTYDVTDPRNLEVAFSKKKVAAMDEDEKMDALNGLWQSFPVSHTYEPGSTFKPFTVAMGLETGALGGKETFVCDGRETFPGNVTVRCVNRSGHGVETIADALADSCNDALMQMSYRIGEDNFAFYQHLFGFGQKTGIDLPGEPRTDTLVFTKQQLKERKVNMATNSFGQNFNTTMVQLAAGFASLVNGGDLYQPRVVKKIEDSAGNVIRNIDPVVLKKTVSEETSAKIRSYLRNVVENGTGSIAAVEGYSVGGKTGTAQKLPRGNGKYLVSFIGIAPAENPELLIYTTIDEPKVADQAHSSYAQEITSNILKQVLPYRNVERIKTKKKGE